MRGYTLRRIIERDGEKETEEVRRNVPDEDAGTSRQVASYSRKRDELGWKPSDPLLAARKAIVGSGTDLRIFFLLSTFVSIFLYFPGIIMLHNYFNIYIII